VSIVTSPRVYRCQPPCLSLPAPVSIVTSPRVYRCQHPYNDVTIVIDAKHIGAISLTYVIVNTES
jgi:hypothetical protein